jgi:hypothetical protein
MEAGRGIYSEDLDVMSYWWRRVFWVRNQTTYPRLYADQPLAEHRRPKYQLTSSLPKLGVAHIPHQV